MGKYIAYFIAVVILVFALDFFKVVDIPYVEVPFSFESKTEGNRKVTEAADAMDKR